MSVTPRIPVVSKYNNSQFVEMRFFRFGDESKTAALLFGILEIIRDNPILREKESLRLPYAAEEYQRKIMDVALSQSTTPQDLLAIWNKDRFYYDNLKSTFQSYYLNDSRDGNFFAFCETQLGVKILNFRETGTKSHLSLYWDEYNESTVLLYTKYAFESFIVSPCNHIHLKSNLFTKAKNAIGNFALNSQEMSELTLNCGYQGCEYNLSQFIFEHSESSATPPSQERREKINNWIRNSDDKSKVWPEKSAHQCQLCSLRAYQNTRCNHCEIVLCKNCKNICTFTVSGFKCFGCKQKMRKSEIREIIREVENIISPYSLQCENCQVSLAKSEFSESLQSGIEAIVCNDCYSEFSSMRNQLISLPASSAPLTRPVERSQSIKLAFVSFEYDLKPNEGVLYKQMDFSRKKCGRCNVEKGKNNFQIWEQLEHKCIICDFCFQNDKYLLFTWCSECFLPREPKEIRVIETFLSRSNTPEEIKMKECACGKPISGKFVCKNKCFCSYCQCTEMILSSTKLCRECSLPCEGYLTPFHKCNGCCRSLYSNLLLYDDPVMGICAKGCILCVFCIKISANRAQCTVCDAIVTTKSIIEILSQQSTISLACYCKSNAGQLTYTSCRHEIHSQCKSATYTCKICKSRLKDKPKMKILSDYIT